MFRVPQLTLTPPSPSYLSWICWKNIVNLEVELEDTSVVDESVTVKTRRTQRDIDMWTAKLSDYDDPFTLAGCLWRISDDEDENGWQKYFRLASRGQAFVWWFDNAKHSSNNPYFELLFRSLRKICERLNGHCRKLDVTIPIADDDTSTAADMDECKVCIQEALKRLNPSQQCHLIDTSGSITRKPKYHESCAVSSCSWLDHNFYTALFTMFTMKEAVENIHNDATELIELAQSKQGNNENKLRETFLRIHFNITHLNDLTVFEKRNTSNPFSIYMPFVSYLEEIQRFLATVGTACNGLLTKDVGEYEKTVTMHVDDFQPSLLRLLKTKGFALATASSSGKCHESDHPQTVAHFTLFVNDKINCDQEDVKRQIELRNVLASSSSIPQIKRTFPKLKRIEFDSTDMDKLSPAFVVATVLDALKRFCDCEYVSVS